MTTTDATGLLDWMARGHTSQAPAPTAIGRAAREEAARSNAADSKLSDVSSLQVRPTEDAVAPQRVLQRVVMPRADDAPEVRPLYFDEPRPCMAHRGSGVAIDGDVAP